MEPFNEKFQLIYEETEMQPVTKVHKDGTSEFFALIIKQTQEDVNFMLKAREYPKGQEPETGLILNLIEIRSKVPMIECFLKISSDPDLPITTTMPLSFREDEVIHHFPLDDEDTEQSLNILKIIAAKIDLTKLRVLSS